MLDSFANSFLSFMNSSFNILRKILLTSGSIDVKEIVNKDSELEIKIVNLLGEIVISERFTASSSLDYYNLNVSHLNSGIYNVVLVSNGTSTTKQLQIIK